MPTVRLYPVANGVFIPVTPKAISGGVTIDTPLAWSMIDEVVNSSDGATTHIEFGKDAHPANWSFKLIDPLSVGITPQAIINTVVVRGNFSRAALGGAATMSIILVKNGEVAQVTAPAAQSTSYNPSSAVLAVNPFNSLPWQPADFTGLEIGAQNAGLSSGFCSALEISVDFTPQMWYPSAAGSSPFTTAPKTGAGNWVTVTPAPSPWSVK